jgi:DNA invertase Pin-like site-specific DNA recombinase
MVNIMRQMFDVNSYVIDIDKLGKIIIYLRKSREDMIDGRYASDEETLSRHEEQLQSWAKNTLGYEIPPEAIFKEIGSGEKIKSRPVFKEVLNMIEQGDVDGVLVLNCSRLSRGDLVDCGNIIKTFEVTKTLVLTPQKLYNLQNKHDKRYFKDELLRGNDYLEQTKELLSNGRHWSTSQGKFVGSAAPFGYDKVTCKEMNVADKRGFTLRPNDNAQYVKMIFDMFLDGIGVYRIATHLKEIKAPAPSVKGWEHCTVTNILSSITYGGYLTWGKRSKQEKIVNHEVVEYRAENKDYPIYKGLHTPIVPYEAVQAAQERLKRQAPANPYERI